MSYRETRVIDGKAMIKLYDNVQVIGHVRVTDKKRLKVELVATDGIKSVHITHQYCTKAEPDNWKPARGALTIPLMSATKGQNPEPIKPLEDLLVVLEECIKQSNDFAIEDPDNELWVEQYQPGHTR